MYALCTLFVILPLSNPLPDNHINNCYCQQLLLGSYFRTPFFDICTSVVVFIHVDCGLTTLPLTCSLFHMNKAKVWIIKRGMQELISLLFQENVGLNLSRSFKLELYS